MLSITPPATFGTRLFTAGAIRQAERKTRRVIIGNRLAHPHQAVIANSTVAYRQIQCRVFAKLQPGLLSC
jgi:hypothetical protein